MLLLLLCCRNWGGGRVLINCFCTDRHSVEMETLYGRLNNCVQHHFFFHLIKDLIERPFGVTVKILVNGNALHFSKVCLHCGVENGSHSCPTQRQNLKTKVLNNYYTEVIDHFVESICQYKEK